MEKDVELFWGYLYPLFETLLFETLMRLISSKRPIDNAMLRPWQRTINLTGNAMKLIDKLIEINAMKLIEKDVEHNDISDINDGRKTSFDKPGGGGAP